MKERSLQNEGENGNGNSYIISGTATFDGTLQIRHSSDSLRYKYNSRFSFCSSGCCIQTVLFFCSFFCFPSQQHFHVLFCFTLRFTYTVFPNIYDLGVFKKKK